MRRWLRPILPVAAIALWLQLLAPVMACQAVAHAAADPLTFAELCRASHDADRPLTDDRDRGPLSSDPASSSDHACCAFCAATHGGALPVDPARDGEVMLWQGGTQQQWLSALTASACCDGRAANRPRAPPHALA